jgi:hypothetical protein
MHELSRVNVAQSLLGVFWGVWFAQFSHSVLTAQNDISIATGQLRAAYVVGALACVLGLTGLLWTLQNVSERLLDRSRGRPLDPETLWREAVRDVLLLLGSYVLISTVVIIVPVGSYLVFRGLSAHEVALSASVIPVWLGTVLALGLARLAFRHG